MSAQTLVDAMCQLLAGDGIGAYSTTEALPAGAVPITVATAPAEPDKAVTLGTYAGGAEPDARNGWEYPRLQVRTRAGDPLAALALDRQCFDSLQARAEQLLPGGTWRLTDSYALQSEAQALGTDDNGRHEYVRNYQLSTELA